MLILLLLPCLAALNLPFYFGVPQYSVTLDANCAAMPFPLYWHRSEEDARVGLRIIVVADGTSYASKKAARRLMAEKLHVSGHLQTGDAVLTFRPYLQDSIAYAHIQMGVTHAGLVYDEEETCFRHSHGKRSTLSRTRRKVLHFRYDFTTSGAAMNIDSPLDSSGEFDAPHYAGEPDGTGGVEALHIIRPRVMASETRRRRLREWVNLVLSGQSQFNGIRHQLEFQPDYVLPRYQDINGTIRQSVTLLGKIVLQIDLTTNLPLFCSEFVFHMISLSACSPDEIRSAGPDGAACVSPDEPFPIMPITAEKSSEIGLADGPLIDLLQIGNRAANQDKTFCSGGHVCVNVNHLSSGHLAVAKQVAPLMQALSQIYAARAAGATFEMLASSTAQINAQLPRNYSPTSFLVHSMVPGVGTNEYVATVLFVDEREYPAYQAIALQQNASCAGMRK